MSARQKLEVYRACSAELPGIPTSCPLILIFISSLFFASFNLWALARVYWKQRDNESAGAGAEIGVCSGD